MDHRLPDLCLNLPMELQQTDLLLTKSCGEFIASYAKADQLKRTFGNLVDQNGKVSATKDFLHTPKDNNSATSLNTPTSRTRMPSNLFVRTSTPRRVKDYKGFEFVRKDENLPDPKIEVSDSESRTESPILCDSGCMNGTVCSSMGSNTQSFQTESFQGESCHKRSISAPHLRNNELTVSESSLLPDETSFEWRMRIQHRKKLMLEKRRQEMRIKDARFREKYRELQQKRLLIDSPCDFTIPQRQTQNLPLGPQRFSRAFSSMRHSPYIFPNREPLRVSAKDPPIMPVSRISDSALDELVDLQESVSPSSGLSRRKPSFRYPKTVFKNGYHCTRC